MIPNFHWEYSYRRDYTCNKSKSLDTCVVTDINPESRRKCCRLALMASFGAKVYCSSNQPAEAQRQDPNHTPPAQTQIEFVLPYTYCYSCSLCKRTEPCPSQTWTRSLLSRLHLNLVKWRSLNRVIPYCI